MTSLLLVLLTWILIGGTLWMWITNDIKMCNEAGKELGLPSLSVDYIRTSRTLLIITLIIGPAIIMPAVIIGIYNWIKELYKGESK